MVTTKQNTKPYKRQFYRGPIPVSVLAPMVVKPALKDKGYYLSTLMLEWPNIVGQNFAIQCRPRNLMFNRNEKGNGRLHLSATSGFAMELGYYTLILTEKINAYFGFALVQKITMDSQLIKITEESKQPSTWQPPSQNLEEALTRLKQCIKNNL